MKFGLAVLAVAAGCQSREPLTDQKRATPIASTPSGSGSAVAALDLDRKDILGRAKLAPDVYVKHVLLAWRELGPGLQNQIDPRAKQRSNAETAALAQDLAAQLGKDPTKIDSLVKQYSEDGNSLNGVPYELTAQTDFVPEFKQLALRLELNEVGIVRTLYGYHVIERVAPPPIDPLESAEILARSARPGIATIQHVMIGWKEATGAQRLADPRAMKRTKVEADKLATETLEKAKHGADFAKLMQETSEDPGSKNSGKTFDVDADSSMPFAKLALRLNDKELGLVQSPFGWHVVKRLAPIEADPLDSTEILKRDPFEHTKIKHILLGWKDLHTEDPRGVTRARETLEKLVKATVARLNKGDKIDPIMAELSEDPLTAKAGKSYTVDAKSELVKPLKDLGLRLRVKEVGVVKSEFGVHVVQRTE